MLTSLFSRVLATCPRQQQTLGRFARSLSVTSRLHTPPPPSSTATSAGSQASSSTLPPPPLSCTTTTTRTTATTAQHSGLDDAEGYVRVASLEDYDDVMAISHDVYDGRDYLPSCYASFVRDPRMHCYVFESNGKVVGFEAGCVVDGGETVVYRGARTTSDMQGHGVMRHLRQHLLGQLTADHSVRYVAMTTSNTSGLASKPSVLKNNDNHLTRSIHVFPWEQSTLDQVPARQDFITQPLRVLTPGQLCDLFDNKILRTFLFPQNRIIINTIPYRVKSENRENIQLENPHVVISEKILHTAQKGDKPKSGLASISTWFPCPVGICVDLEFYGRSSHFPELCNHVGHHLRHVRHLAPHGQLMVPHAKEVGQDALLCAMARFSLTPMDCPFKRQFLFEQDLQKHPL